jgi:hypothetical protein
MPMSFPDLESLIFAAEVWNFRPQRTVRARPSTAPPVSR